MNDTGQAILVREWCDDGYFHHPQAIEQPRASSGRNGGKANSAHHSHHSSSLSRPAQPPPSAHAFVSQPLRAEPVSLDDDVPSYKPKAKKKCGASDSAANDNDGFGLLDHADASPMALPAEAVASASKPKSKPAKQAQPQSQQPQQQQRQQPPPHKGNQSVAKNTSNSANYCMPEFLSASPAPNSLPLPRFASVPHAQSASSGVTSPSPQFSPTPQHLLFSTISPPQRAAAIAPPSVAASASPGSFAAFLSTLPISVGGAPLAAATGLSHQHQQLHAATALAHLQPQPPHNAGAAPNMPGVIFPNLVSNAAAVAAAAPSVAAPVAAPIAAPQLILRKQGRVEVVGL